MTPYYHDQMKDVENREDLLFRQSRETRMGFWAYAPIIVILGLRLASESTANLSYVALAAYAFIGPSHVIRALALSWLFTMISPGLAPGGDGAAVGRYGVLFAAAASSMLHSGLLSKPSRPRPFTLATLLLGMFIIGHSLLISAIPDISVLKGVAWALVMSALVTAWCSLSDWRRYEVSQQIFWGLILIVIASLPLATSSLGYLRNGSGFQGILNHPQNFGSMSGLLCAWATADLLGEKRPRWWLLGIAAGSLACMLMSEMRTAGFAVVLGVGGAVLFGPSFARRPILHMLPGLRSARIWTVLGAIMVAGVAMAPTVIIGFNHYLSKSGRAEVGGVMDAFDNSRGKLMDIMLNNIRQHPLGGIGFGIASDPMLMVDVSRDPIFGLPVGAPTEKGVAPLMVVEELGAFGAVLVALWVFWLVRNSARGGVRPMAVCLTALMLNMGEATLFSPSGFGLLSMLLLGYAFSTGQPKAQ
jgi:hypothetical protein